MFGITSIIGIITGLAGPIAEVTGKITDLKRDRVKAESDQERAKIGAELEEAQGRRAVLLIEATNRLAGGINAVMRAFIAIGPASYIAKYYLWDKVIGSFVGCSNLRGSPKAGCDTFATDGLSTEMAAVMTAVIAFYLAYDLTARFRRK